MASYTLEYTNYSGHATVEPAVTGASLFPTPSRSLIIWGFPHATTRRRPDRVACSERRHLLSATVWTPSERVACHGGAEEERQPVQVAPHANAVSKRSPSKSCASAPPRVTTKPCNGITSIAGRRRARRRMPAPSLGFRRWKRRRSRRCATAWKRLPPLTPRTVTVSSQRTPILAPWDTLLGK